MKLIGGQPDSEARSQGLTLRSAGSMGTHPRMSVAAVTTAATAADVTTSVTATQAPAAQAQAAQAQEQKADDSGLQETPLPNTLEMKRIRDTIVAEQRKEPILGIIIQKL